MYFLSRDTQKHYDFRSRITSKFRFFRDILKICLRVSSKEGKKRESEKKRDRTSHKVWKNYVKYIIIIMNTLTNIYFYLFKMKWHLS